MKANESQCEWFSNARCMEVKKKDRLFVYVFEDFRGESFQNILATGNRYRLCGHLSGLEICGILVANATMFSHLPPGFSCGSKHLLPL